MPDLLKIVLVVVIYFVPALVANLRKARNENLIGVINLFLGWTVLGWFVALAMALDAKPREKKDCAVPADKDHKFDRLAKLGEMREKGLLTDEEFTVEKQKLLSQN